MYAYICTVILELHYRVDWIGAVVGDRAIAGHTCVRSIWVCLL